jgi:undecaprenyl diphosphate synthase
MRKLKHIAFIVDGNRRWARKKGLSLTAGHKLAANKRLEEIVDCCLKSGISYATFWVFSTENWKRGKKFALMLFKILRAGLKRNIEKFIKNGVKLNTIGDLTRLPKGLVKDIEAVKKQSKHNKKLVVTIAINYGGRDEILRAVKRVCKEKKNIDKLTESEFANFLDTADLPDPDLIVRTGGDKRLSGFMVWQAQYSELYFTKTLFPDFGKKEFNRALKEFNLRQRRFGR